MKPALLAMAGASLLMASCGATADSFRVGSDRPEIEITHTVKVRGVKADRGLESVLAETAKVEGAKNGR
ncbi:MAG: hypothetical protein HZB29_13940 [Nitrospinae bacterium]|nr:hypothetical protein [Nitrospinota bacterium]